MKMNLEYGFNNESMPKFEEYEIKVINNIKYVVPKILEIHRTNYSLIDFDDYMKCYTSEDIRKHIQPLIENTTIN